MENGKPTSLVDHTALRSNQAVIIGSLVAGFVLDSVVVVVLVGALMLIGTALHTQAFRWVYVRILRPLRVASPDPVPDHPEPHRFAQGLGGVVLVAGSSALFLGASIIGWVLVWLVIVLAAVNLFLGFCVGCFAYYWLARWHLPGFSHAPPANTFPGTRPPRL